MTRDPAMLSQECMHSFIDSTNWIYWVIKNKTREHNVAIGTYWEKSSGN